MGLSEEVDIHCWARAKGMAADNKLTLLSMEELLVGDRDVEHSQQFEPQLFLRTEECRKDLNSTCSRTKYTSCDNVMDKLVEEAERLTLTDAFQD